MKTSFEAMEAALRNGELQQLDIASLKSCLAEIHGFSHVNPNFVHTPEVMLLTDTVRHLIATKEAEESSLKHLRDNRKIICLTKWILWIAVATLIATILFGIWSICK